MAAAMEDGVMSCRACQVPGLFGGGQGGVAHAAGERPGHGIPALFSTAAP